MRYTLTVFCICLMAVGPAFAASGSVARLTGGQVSVEAGGASSPLPQETFPTLPIEDTGMSFLGIGEEDGKEHGLAAGLYIFKGDGEAVAFAPTDAAEYCAEVKMSPAGDVLAMDAGTWLTRSWFFFSFPEMQPLGEVAYYQAEDRPALLWAGNHAVVFSSIETENQGRVCEYDPCGPISVNVYRFKTKKIEKLIAGTDLCDYTLTGLTHGGKTVTAQKACMSAVKDWEQSPENALAEEVEAALSLP